MNIEEERELKNRIRRIAEKVIRSLMEPEKAAQGALVLVPSFVMDKAPLASCLRLKYGSNVTCTGVGASVLEPEFKAVGFGTPQDQQRLMESLKDYTDIVLVSPPLWMLRNIAGGDDRGIFEQAFIRALLWEKDTALVLDFEKPRFKRGTFFEDLNDALGAIEGMGAKIETLQPPVGKPAGELPLVTETEVNDAHREGRTHIRCAEGAIVTPLAWDAAKELGIAIDT
jgi:hypothetical protein